MSKTPAVGSSSGVRIVNMYLTQVEILSSDGGFAKILASEPDPVAAMIDALRTVALKIGYIKRVGERLEVTPKGKSVQPNPALNL